jgi:hypothetical protein
VADSTDVSVPVLLPGQVDFCLVNRRISLLFVDSFDQSSRVAQTSKLYA